MPVFAPADGGFSVHHAAAPARDACSLWVTMPHLNSFGSRATLDVDGTKYTIFRLDALRKLPGSTADRLPFSLKVLLENLLRNEDDAFVKPDDITTLATWDVACQLQRELSFRTSRVLLQDFTGVPAVVDLAAMRDAITRLGGDPRKINPLQPVDLVIDHSVQVDEYGTDAAFLLNTEREFERNLERYQFLRDRKSTRLNSSHLVISYAVFCLKQKTHG